MTKSYYSIRTGKNKNIGGVSLEDLKELFLKVYKHFNRNDFFVENIHRTPDDDIELEILLKIRKQSLWPIEICIHTYEEDDLFDIMEFLYQKISKPIEGSEYEDQIYWDTFNKTEGQSAYREKINEVLALYEKPYELSTDGEILQKSESGFEQIFEADIPTSNEDIRKRLEAAILKYRRHGSTLDDRRAVIRDLVDVIEYLRPQVKSLLTKKDESDLFNIANNFGIRHHNEKQKTDYDAALWLSWMFYFYLSTIHVILRKIQKEKT